MSGCYIQLQRNERILLAKYRSEGLSIGRIATLLSRSKSTISRELRRNGFPSFYHVGEAERRRKKRHFQPPRKLHRHRWLHRYVFARLKKGWSPQQISARLRHKLGKDSNMLVSHETIYATIYAYPRGELRRELIKALRQSRSKRRPRSGGKDRRSQIPDLKPISERPPEVEDRLMPGHWEGDLIMGARNQSCVGSLVERTSRFLILVQMDNKTSPVVTGGFERELSPLPEDLRRTLTYDRGTEMTQHLKLTNALNIDVYFADPHSPWQRGSNENTNGLVRQYLPKGTDLSHVTQEQLNEIAALINGRPRKCLDWNMPKHLFKKIAAQCTIKNQTQTVALHP